MIAAASIWTEFRITRQAFLLLAMLLTAMFLMTPVQAQWYFPPDPGPEPAVTSTTVTLPSPSFAVANTIREISFSDAAGVGSLPQGITAGLDPDGEEAILVAEVNGGQAHYYDLDLTFVETIDIPEFTDGDQYLGVAYNSTTETYFWVKASPSALIESDADGAFIDIYDFDTPSDGGQIVDITYNDVTESLWAYDFLNDEIFEITTDGALTGESFLSPTYVTEGLFGNTPASASGKSISHMPGTDCFDITTGRGQDIDQVIHRMARIDVNGVATGQTFQLPPGGTAFIGHTYHATGSTDVPVVYVVDQTTGLIQEIEVSAECDPCAISGSVTDFACETNLADSEVTLNWTVVDSPDSMELWSRGEFLREIDSPDDGELVLDDIDAGFYDFTLSYTIDDDTCQTGNCATIVTGPGAEDGQLIKANESGIELLGITVIPEAAGSTDGVRIVCPGGLSGLTHIYDVDLELIETVDSPQPASDGFIIHAGVAYNPDDEQLYFIAADLFTTEFFLLTTDLDDFSVVLDEFTFEDPDGPGVVNLFGGMDVNIDGDGFIVNDIFNDTYFIYDFEGELSDTDGFDSPFLEANGGVVTIGGNGVAKVPGEDIYELNLATPGSTITNIITWVDGEGNQLAPCQWPVGPLEGFVYDTWMQSQVLVEDPSADLDGIYRYSVGNSDLLFRERVTCSPCEPVFDLACLWTLDDEVELTWTNGGDLYSEIEILRNGESIASLEATDTSYTDESPDLGENVYEIAATCDANDITSTTTCTTWTVADTVTTIVWSAELDTGSIDSAAAMAAALEAIDVDAAIVGEVLNMDLSRFDAVFCALGTLPYNRALTDAEIAHLGDFLLAGTGKGLYVEGGDLFDSDDNTDLTDLLGIALASTGEDICDVTRVIGQDSGVTDGLDLSEFEADWDCEGGGQDEIDAITGGGSGIVFVSDGGDSAGVMVYTDGALSTAEVDYKAVSSSAEFGGYEADQTLLMEAIYGGLVGMTFIRGDVNGNGETSALIDALRLLTWAFADGEEPPCLDAADIDDDGDVSPLLDALRLLLWGFSGGDAPPDPGPNDCGTDPTDDDLDCETVADECV